MTAARLLPHHAALIAASSITDAVRDARGYYSATSREELVALRFDSFQRRVPALAIPIFGVSGSVSFHQIRSPGCTMGSTAIATARSA